MAKGHSVVAAGHELTVQAAAEILQDGGNAFDAALAGALMTFVAEAVFASPGGGGFLMARRAGRSDATLFDFFAETPLQRRAADEVSFYPIYADFGPAKQEFHIGLGASATPGAVAGLFAVHEALGTLPMKRLAEPAVRAARAGFPLTPFQAYLFTVIAPILTASRGVAAIFAPDGKLLEAGQTFRNAGLSDMLELLAEDGARLFIDGDVGRAIAEQSRTLGGHLTGDDLKRYRVERREPLTWRYAGATVALNPPPAASGALIAFGFAYLEALGERGRAIDVAALREAMEATNAARATHGEGLAARLAGGNGFIVGNFGFMLNNMLGEDDLGTLDAWREGTRMSSMMAPTIVLAPDGTVTALGTGGSNRIRTAILQVAVNLLDHGMDLERAVEAARLHVEREGKVSFEPGLPDGAEEALLAGAPEAHAWPARNLFFGGVHAARRHANGGVEGAGDPRRRGVAVVI